jgi:hypothetical protein
LDRKGLLHYQAELLQLIDSKPATTYTQAKEFLEQRFQVTCSKNTMMHFMQSPVSSMESVSIDVLRTENYINVLKAVYSDRVHISMYALRFKLAVKFNRTASNDTMYSYELLQRRPGLGRRLRAKTYPYAPVVVAEVHISPYYLDKIYEHISENPSITVQGLSEYFLADHGKFFDVEQFRAATTRLKRRHAIFKAWQSELDQDFGLRHNEGSIDPPTNIGSMSEYDFFYRLIAANFAIVAACGHSLLSDVRRIQIVAMWLTSTSMRIRCHMCVGRAVGPLSTF